MKAKIFRAAEVDWIEAPGHYSAFSKLLISESDGSKYFDFRVSSYEPKGYCEAHTHETAEMSICVSSRVKVLLSWMEKDIWSIPEW